MKLTELRYEKCLTMGKHDLISYCESVFNDIKADQHQKDNVEIATTPSKSEEWFRFRSGRIVASHSKQLARLQ